VSGGARTGRVDVRGAGTRYKEAAGRKMTPLDSWIKALLTAGRAAPCRTIWQTMQGVGSGAGPDGFLDCEHAGLW